MKKHTSILLFLLMSLLQTTAQNTPWNAKFIVHHPAGLTDTVWFGCDTAGNWGYQTGLDSIDTTSFQAPISILAYDSIVEEEFNTPDCTNLKRDVKGFKTGLVRFNFYTVMDSFPVFLSWDTLDFLFENESFLLRGAYMQSLNGYFTTPDKDIYVLYNSDRPLNKFDPDSIAILTENPAFECTLNTVFKFSLFIAFNYDNTVIHQINSEPIRIFPIPTFGEVNIHFDNEFTGTVSTYNTKGQFIKSVALIQESKLRLNFDSKKGLFFLHIRDSKNNIVSIKKVLVQ